MENKAQAARDVLVRNNEFLQSKFGESGSRPISSIDDMVSLGLAVDNKTLTPEGRRYKALVDKGFISRDGSPTKTGQAFLTPKEDLLDPDQITNLTSTLSTQDPKTLEKFELYKIRKNSGIDVQNSEESLIKGIISGLGDVARTTGIAIGESGATKEQRDAARMAIIEGAIETPIQMSGKTGAFIDKFVINPVKRASGVPQEQLDANEAWADYQNDSRQAMYDNMTGASLVDAVTDTTQGSEIYQTAKQQFIDRDGPVQGEINFNKLVAGGAGAGSMATDPLGLALSAFTLGGGILPKLSKISKIAKAESTALQATSQLERLGEAASLVGRQIDDTTAQIGTLQKSIDDAVLVGDNATATQLTSDLRLQTSKLDNLNKRAGMLDEGAQVNQRMFQQASTKIDDLNAPSMLGQKIQSGAIRKLADTADVLGNVTGKMARGIKFVERKLGVYRTPWLIRAITASSAPQAFATYYGIRQGLVYGAPALKKLAQFGNTISDELLEATGSSPFWRRVAANQSTGRLGQAFAGLMDYTTPIRRGVASPIKGAAKALPATTLYEAINAGGLDEAALERAGANAFVFGPIARLVGGKKDWDRAPAGDLYNFRSKLRSTDEAKFNAFESIPDKPTKQFISSFDAAYPGMYDYKFTQSGNSLFDDNPKSPTFKTAIINVNDKPGMIRAIAAHEINHGLQFLHQSDDAVKALMLGSEGKKGMVRDADGNLDPEFKAWGDEYNSRLEAQDIPTKSVDDLAIEYYTDIGAQTLFEDVVSGRVYKAGQKTKARRKIEEVFNKTMSATPIIKDLHFKFGGATDGNGRMIMGSGLLADGIRELPEVKAMVRNMYRESAGLPSKSEVAPNDGFSQATNPIHHQAADTIRELNQAAVKSKTPLIDAALQPDAKGNGAGRLPSEYFEELEARGIIPEGTWGMAVDINENMDLPVSYLLNYRPVRQGRSAQIDGRTANNVKFIGWGLYNGRLYLAAMDMNQLNINISRATKSNVAKNLKMSRNDIMNDIDAVADLQSKNKSTDDYFKRVAEEAGQGKKWKLRKNFINATQGLLTPDQAVKNPMFNALGQNTKSGIYRTFAFDLLDNATRMTGTKVVDYGPNSYYTLKTNLMPQMPRVNRNGELVTEPTSAKGVRFMPEKVEGDKFYSQLDRVISSKIPNRATPRQIMSTIDPTGGSGIKAEEIKWSGIEQALPKLAVDGKVSKDALLNYLRDEGQVKFEEVTLSDAAKPLQWEQSGNYWFARSGGFRPRIEKLINGKFRLEGGSGSNSLHPSLADAQREAADMSRRMGSSSVQDPTKYAQYQLPGGENYREVVLTIPTQGEKRTPNQIAQAKYGKDFYDLTRDQMEEINSEMQKNLRGTDASYTSSHFPDIPNYVAHMRTNERVDADGRPGLFVEEFQSDRHQEGRKKGYLGDKGGVTTPPKTEDDLIALGYTKRSNGYVETYFDQDGNAAGYPLSSALEYAAERIKENDVARGAYRGIPDAPFRTTWPLQLFKRALRDAVDSGKDWIGWTVGETQNDRFDLSKQVDAVKWGKSPIAETYDISYVKDGRTHSAKYNATPEELPDLVGKEVAQKIINASQTEFKGELRGLDLEVGGSGMKGFYDNMLPKEIGKYVKQFGGKVEKSEVATPSPTKRTDNLTDAELLQELNRKGDTLPIWKVSITPEMRKIAKTGQSRFMPKSGKKQSGKVRRSTFEGSSTKPKNNKKIADSISLLLSGQSSRQMEREERNNQ